MTAMDQRPRPAAPKTRDPDVEQARRSRLPVSTPVAWSGLIVGLIVGWIVSANMGSIAIPHAPGFIDGLVTLILSVIVATILIEVVFVRRRKEISAQIGRGKATAQARWQQRNAPRAASASVPDAAAWPEVANWPAPAAQSAAEPVANRMRPAPRQGGGDGQASLTRPVGNPARRGYVPQRATVAASRIAGDRTPNAVWLAVIAEIDDLDTTEDVQLVEGLLDQVAGIGGYTEALVERHELMEKVQGIDPDSLRTLSDVSDALIGALRLIVTTTRQFIEHHELPDEYKALGGKLANNADEFHTGQLGEL